jgi:hypothetical protein
MAKRRRERPPPAVDDGPESSSIARAAEELSEDDFRALRDLEGVPSFYLRVGGLPNERQVDEVQKKSVAEFVRADEDVFRMVRLLFNSGDRRVRVVLDAVADCRRALHAWSLPQPELFGVRMADMRKLCRPWRWLRGVVSSQAAEALDRRRDGRSLERDDMLIESDLEGIRARGLTEAADLVEAAANSVRPPAATIVRFLDAEFRTYSMNLDRVVRDFQDRHYEDLIRESKEAMGSLFDRSLYPAKIHIRATLRWVATRPAFFGDPDLQKRIQEQFFKDFGQMADYVIETTLKEFDQTLADIRTRLTEVDESGVLKSFRSGRFERLSQVFQDAIADLGSGFGIRGERFDSLVREVREKLGGLKTSEFNWGPGKGVQAVRQRREELARTMDVLRAQLAACVENQPFRKIFRD